MNAGLGARSEVVAMKVADEQEKALANVYLEGDGTLCNGSSVQIGFEIFISFLADI
jgi:hypothetical protein